MSSDGQDQITYQYTGISTVSCLMNTDLRLPDDTPYLLRFLFKTEGATADATKTQLIARYADNITEEIIADTTRNGADYVEVRYRIDKPGHRFLGLSLIAGDGAARTVLLSSFGCFPVTEETFTFEAAREGSVTVTAAQAFHGYSLADPETCDTVYPLEGYADCRAHLFTADGSNNFSLYSSTGVPTFRMDLPFSSKKGLPTQGLSDTFTLCSDPNEVAGGKWRACLSEQYMYFTTNSTSTNVSAQKTRLNMYGPHILYVLDQPRRVTFPAVSPSLCERATGLMIPTQADVRITAKYN